MPSSYLSILNPAATPDDVSHLCDEAMARGAPGVVVAPIHVACCAKRFRDRPPQTIAAIAFPFGMSKPVIKAIEATSCLKEGADGVWIVPRWPGRTFDANTLRDELLEIARAIRAAKRDAMYGVIVDRAWLADHSVELQRAIREGAADAIVLVGAGDARLEADDLQIIETDLSLSA